MVPSKFNLQVPLPDRGEVFLMNTLSDAQLLVTPDVSNVLARLERGESNFNEEEREALDALRENGFLVSSYEDERRDLVSFFKTSREDTEEVRLTVLTTLQCNFACDYCMQGDHGDHNLFAHKMSLETAHEIVGWVEQRLDLLKPKKFALTFFGGEPLLNVPVVRIIAEGCYARCAARGVEQTIMVITNGLLLTPELVDELKPFGLNNVKVTLDGDRDTHNRMRPLRGGQGTFDRIIENLRQVAHKVPIYVGGNFDESSADTYPALLDFLREQEFADKLSKVNFKPIIKAMPNAPKAKGTIPLTVVGSNGKPLGGACMTAAGAGGTGKSGSMCDSCYIADEKLEFLRDETRKRGFHTSDGVHMGPCEIHKRHAYTIGIDGVMYACPGFGTEASESIGHINPVLHSKAPAAERFERLNPLKEECGDCSFIPVCGGGCSVAAHTEEGDLHTRSCHKGAMDLAIVSLAQRVAASVG